MCRGRSRGEALCSRVCLSLSSKSTIVSVKSLEIEASPRCPGIVFSHVQRIMSMQLNEETYYTVTQLNLAKLSLRKKTISYVLPDPLVVTKVNRPHQCDILLRSPP